MGIVNVTPDSFSDGGRYSDVEKAIAHAQQLVHDGAAILDIGGESTRPGAAEIDVETELARVEPIFLALRTLSIPVTLSIDTSKAAVAKRMLDLGATMVNDVSALGDPEMAHVVAQAGAQLILMHRRGTPQTMQSPQNLHYTDVVEDVIAELNVAITRALTAGIAKARLLVDPGIGFSKTTAQNVLITKHLHEFKRLGLPIVYGPSRKRFLGEILGGVGAPAHTRDVATAIACVTAMQQGATIVRVHNVKATRDALRVALAMDSSTEVC